MIKCQTIIEKQCTKKEIRGFLIQRPSITTSVWRPFITSSVCLSWPQITEAASDQNLSNANNFSKPEDDSWSVLSDMNVGRTSAGVIGNGLIYVIGRSDERGNALSNMDIYINLLLICGQYHH